MNDTNIYNVGTFLKFNKKYATSYAFVIVEEPSRNQYGDTVGKIRRIDLETGSLSSLKESFIVITDCDVSTIYWYPFDFVSNKDNSDYILKVINKDELIALSKKYSNKQLKYYNDKYTYFKKQAELCKNMIQETTEKLNNFENKLSKDFNYYVTNNNITNR